MSNLAVASLRHASRLCLKQSGLSAALLRNPTTRAAVVASLKTSRREYVSETKPDNAQVNLDTAIRGDQKAFVQQAGKIPESQIIPGTSVNADVMMNPIAGLYCCSEHLEL
jgi:cysteine desulfurase